MRKTMSSVGSSTVMRRQGNGIVEISHRVADIHALQSDHGTDVSGSRLIGLNAAETIEGIQLGHGIVDAPAVMLEHGDVLPLVDFAGNHAADGNAADIVAAVKRHHQHLQRRIHVDLLDRHVAEDGTVERLQVDSRDSQVSGGDALAPGSIDRREIEGGIIGVKLDEQIKDAVEHLAGAGIGPVDLVDNDDGTEPASKALRSTKRVCGIGPSAASTSKQGAVGHLQNAFDLAAEIGVPRRIDDVDLDAVHRQGDVLGQDGDAAFSFQVVRVENQPVLSAGQSLQLAGAKQAGLAHHLIHQRRLAMIDVGNNGHISNIGALHVQIAWSVSSVDAIPGESERFIIGENAGMAVAEFIPHWRRWVARPESAKGVV